MSMELIGMLAVGATIAGLNLLSFRSLRREIENLRSELRGEIESLRNEFRSEIANLHEGIRAVNERLDALSDRVSALAERVAKLEGLLEGLRETFRREAEAV